MTRKEYLLKKKSSIQKAPMKKLGVEVQKTSTPSLILSEKEFILQDPDMKTYEDVINIKGKMIKRNCHNGIIKTKNKNLVDFLKSKGYILINNEV